VTYELDIMSTEVTETGSYTGDLNRGGSVRPIGVQTLLSGKLHLRLANIGEIYSICDTVGWSWPFSIGLDLQFSIVVIQTHASLYLMENYT